MAQITRLYHFEEVRLDKRRLRLLAADLGDAGADRVVSRAMDEIAVRLTRIETAYEARALARVANGARGLAVISDQTGLSGLRDVALAVAGLAGTRDSAALAACVARLIRVGEMSLVTVWDVHDISL